jgi:beta-phosphoglucomutase-like phosphatase (HAD superfamily)
MATTTKPAVDAFDVDKATEKVRDLTERVQEASRKATLTYLDSYEKAVESLADLEVKAATATKAPLVISLAEAHADLAREFAAAGTGAARSLLVD